MLDVKTYLKTVHRPKLLLQAARINLARYNRERHLGHVLKERLPTRMGPRECLMYLIDEERHQNTERLEKAASYEISHHILVLTAMLAELGRL